jgi:hypothetical protein
MGIALFVVGNKCSRMVTYTTIIDVYNSKLDFNRYEQCFFL